MTPFAALLKILHAGYFCKKKILITNRSDRKCVCGNGSSLTSQVNHYVFCQKETDISVHNIDEINAHFVLCNFFGKSIILLDIFLQ